MSIHTEGHDTARITVHRLRADAAGHRYRQVDFLGLEVGHAYSPDDVKVFMRKCGMSPDLFDQDGVIQWLGEGPGVWG